MTDAPTRTFEVRHLQLARAFLAAMAAIMITFSADHSAAVGLAVFSGFAIATSLVFFAAAWLVFAAGERAPAVLLGVVTLVTGMITGLPPLRTTTMFFVVVIVWAAASGLIELIAGLRARRTGDPYARDAILIGAVTLALAVALLLVNPAYSLEYFIKEAGASFTLTGITIGVGLFGGYAAIVAVFLGIAGFSQRRTAPAGPAQPASTPTTPTAEPGDAPVRPAGETRMTDPRPTRRDLMKPVQLLGFGFAAAAFGGLITLVSMGFFQDLDGDERMHVIVVSLIVAGIAFIATLVIIALLMLAVDPAQVVKPVDRAVLLPESEDAGDAGDADAEASDPRP